MSNMPDINSKRITVTIALPLFAQLLRFAKEHNLSTNDAARLIFMRQLESIELTYEDYLWVAEQVKLNTEKRKGSYHE